MTAANDWTKEMATKGFPELQALYKLLGAEKNVQLFANTHFNHNYNYVSRAAFFSFINKHFKLGIEEPVVEEDYPRLTRDEMTVWDVAHPQPAGGLDFERKLCQQLYEASQKQLAALQPKDAASLAKWREVVGGAAESLLGRSLPAAKELEFEKTEETEMEGYLRFAGLLKNKQRGEEVPIAFLHPRNWNGRVVLWLSEQGKAALFAADGAPAADIKRLMDAGISVAGVDLLFQGELNNGQTAAKNRSVKNQREFAGYTYGYNHALLAQRAHDVLTAISFIKHNDQEAQSVELVALDGTAPIAAVALSQSGSVVNRAVLDTRGFRFGKLTDYLDASFLPGGAKYGDLPGFLSLAAPAKLWLAGETEESAAIVKQAYTASGNADAIAIGKPDDTKAAALAYLLK
jgi:hypothetical protein